jgi:DNA gyrase subunit A
MDDEVYAITSAGGVIRTSAKEVRKAGRQTKGVRLMNLGDGTTLVAIARSAEEPNGSANDADSADADDTEADGTEVDGTEADVVVAAEDNAETPEDGPVEDDQSTEPPQ